jgi:hypothetical protein
MYIDYPFHLDSRGRIANTDREDYIRDLIEQILFTNPGERVNRPGFGTGVMQLVFAPNSDELATATEFMVQGALQQWLGELVEIKAVKVSSEDSTLTVTIEYVVRSNQERRQAQFSREV